MNESREHDLGINDPGMIASETGMRARDPWEMEQRVRRSHTAGPWKVLNCERPRASAPGGYLDGIWIYSYRDGDNTPINTIVDTRVMDAHPLKEADRLLIQAAPKLLSACKAALRIAVHHREPFERLATKACDMLRGRRKASLQKVMAECEAAINQCDKMPDSVVLEGECKTAELWNR